jgi:hypothetical protein
MNRREFIAALGGTAMSLAAHAQRSPFHRPHANIRDC